MAETGLQHHLAHGAGGGVALHVEYGALGHRMAEPRGAAGYGLGHTPRQGGFAHARLAMEQGDPAGPQVGGEHIGDGAVVAGEKVRDAGHGRRDDEARPYGRGRGGWVQRKKITVDSAHGGVREGSHDDYDAE